MLSVEDALARCLAASLPVRTETVAVRDALDRVLAEPVLAGADLPPWSNSAMDGYAVRSSDTARFGAGAQPDCDGGAPRPRRGVALRVTSTLPAGARPSVPVEPGTCARIFTGAPIPPGADAVVMQENVEVLEDGRVQILGVAREGQHVRRAGEDVAHGAVALQPGLPLTPAALGLCASLGHTHVVVARPPRVAVLSTGDEIVPPGQPLTLGQIWSSNSAALQGYIRQAGGEPVDCGNAPDDPVGARAAFERVLAADPDVIVSTGGVSVGDYDVVKSVLQDLGVEMAFWKVAMKPGKPLAFGTIGGTPTFGLPGNPVSCQVGFLQFVRPALRRALGHARPFLPVVDAVLVEELSKRPGRAELVRVALAQAGGRLEVRRAGPQGSGQASTFARAHGLLLFGAEMRSLRAGDRVQVQVFDWGFADGAEPGLRWSGRPG